ncbi:MAG: LptF/LptG family permease [Bacteroidetes bacterium]|nr:LptF/LptG family permease [Bacteroidota bacterium]
MLTFCISLFVLVMQFLWKYVDDLVGKGLSTWILAQLIFYASAQLVPMALPLAVLLSSIMTLGSLGEHMELTAAKSAGISLQRIMLPVFIAVFFISIFAFFFSNNILPIANLKRNVLIYDIQHQKPTVAIKEGIFFNEIDGFSLRVTRKNEDSNLLYNILVYDHTSGQGDDHIITAAKGSMTQDDKHMALTLHLENGDEYKELAPKKPDQQNYEMYHTSFGSWDKKFDLSRFKLTRTDENFFKDMKQMMNVPQLVHQMDTIGIERDALVKGLHTYVVPYYGNMRTGLDTLKKLPAVTGVNFNLGFRNADDMLRTFTAEEKNKIMERALTQARNIKNYADIVAKQVDFKNSEIVKHEIEIYRKFTLSIACMVLFLIGAPLGSIIRKGGLGWPLFYSIIFFIIYHVTSIIGEKTAEKMVISAPTGMWMATMVLTPIGIFLTYKAANDSKLFDIDSYLRFFKKLRPGRNV